MTANRDIISSFYNALSRGDLPAATALLKPDIEWTEAERFPYYGGSWRGPEAIVKGLFEPLSRDWTRFSAQPQQYVVEGDQVVVFGVYDGVHKRSGRTLTAPFAHHWAVRKGKIARFVQYTDTAKVLEAVRD